MGEEKWDGDRWGSGWNRILKAVAIAVDRPRIVSINTNEVG
jgi:hypothetical protein